MRRRRSLRSLGIQLEVLQQELAPRTLLAEVQQVWPAAVGEAIAAAASPTSERTGVLTISCSASVWAHELQLMGPDLIARVNGLLGREEIVGLRCISASPVS